MNFKYDFMYCKHCGKQISDDSTFCQYCGGLQTGNTTTTLSHISVDIVEHPKESMEDKARKILKILIRKLLQFIGIVTIAFVSALVVFYVFMFINKPCSDRDEAFELDKNMSKLDYGAYKYDYELSSRYNLWTQRWYICEDHALPWSIWTFIIILVVLLGVYFFKWLYQPKMKKINNSSSTMTDET